MILRYRWRIGKREWRKASSVANALKHIQHDMMAVVQAGTAQIDRAYDDGPWVPIVRINLDGLTKEDIND